MGLICTAEQDDSVNIYTYFIRLLLLVDEIFLHIEQRLVVIHVLGQVGISWVLLQEGVGRCYSLLQVVKLGNNR